MLDAIGAGLAPRVGDRDWADIWRDSPEYTEMREEIDFAVAEFCILPLYRRAHLGRQAIEEIFRTHRGRWEIKYNRRNPAAEKFWIHVTAGFQREILALEDEDRVICFRND